MALEFIRRGADYWKKRFENAKKSSANRTAKFLRSMKTAFEYAKRALTADVGLWLRRIAGNTGLSLAEARRQLDAREREEFRWTLEEYARNAEDGILAAELENAAAKWRISYLEAMEAQIDAHAERLFAGVEASAAAHVAEGMNESYIRTTFELQKGLGIGTPLRVPYNERKLEAILSEPWTTDGLEFSEKIWANRTRLAAELKRTLAEECIRGGAPEDALRELAVDVDRSEFQTRRLLDTESAFFDQKAETDCARSFGIEKFRFLAMLDLKTSKKCREMDNRVFDEKDRVPGVNSPPLHPFCRSTTAPVVDEGALATRMAKNFETGEYYEIPASMTYDEWRGKFVDEHQEEAFWKAEGWRLRKPKKKK